MTTIGSFTDTKGITVRVYTQNGNVCVEAQGVPHYRNPSPHMNSSMALAMVLLLERAAGQDHGGHTQPLTRTGRGFKVFGEQFLDQNGNEVWVQESSSAGSACVWLFTNDPRVSRSIQHLNPYKSPDTCMSVEQALNVAAQLEHFAVDAEAPDNWRNSKSYRRTWRDFEQDDAMSRTSADGLQEILKARVVFGLEAQGHITTIEQMLQEDASWNEIGKAIGWHGPTAQRYYQRYLDRLQGKDSPC